MRHVISEYYIHECEFLPFLQNMNALNNIPYTVANNNVTSFTRLVGTTLKVLHFVYLQPKILSAHDDKIRSMAATDTDFIISGTGSNDGYANVWKLNNDWFNNK